MYINVILAVCFQTIFVQIVSSQCLGGPVGWVGPSLIPNLGYDRYVGPLSYDFLGGALAFEGLAPWAGRDMAFNGVYAPTIDVTPTSSGGLIVTSSSPVAPTGISVISENAFEGILAVAGEVPFVGTTSMEGIVPTTGAAAVSHSCGNGNNAMVSDIAGYSAGLYAPVDAMIPAITTVIAPAAASVPSVSPVIAPAAAIVPGIASAIIPTAGYGCSEYLY